MSIIENEQIKQKVRKQYGEIAVSSDCCTKGSQTCCSYVGDSTKLGYSTKEISDAPQGADMGLGCGNPVAIASLKEGEIVVDLGCGGGLDCFLAAKKVGNAGKVIGIDMTPEMISKARLNAEKSGYKNVEFRLGEIENLPVADNFADVVMSNCVINLSPDKQRVFDESYRILKKGGRIIIMDVVSIKEIPQSLKQNNDVYCGCFGNAATKEEIEKMLIIAGFSNVNIELKLESKEFIKNWSSEIKADLYICSALITGKK